MMTETKKKWIFSDRIWEWMITAGILFMLAVIACANIFHFTYKLNADLASDAILARLIWESREWIPSTWYIANEVRIICTPNLAALLYGLTGNMILAEGLACTLLTVGICVSAYWCVRQCLSKRIYSLLFVLLCLIISNNYVILELFYLWAAYYAVHIIAMFLTLGTYIRIIKKEKMEKNDLLLLLGCLVFLFLLGMQGTRGILILSGPMLAIELLRFLYGFYRKSKFDRDQAIIHGWVWLLNIAGFLGTLFEFSVGQNLSRNIRKGPAKLLGTVIPDVGRCLGLGNGNIIHQIILCLGLVLLAVEIIIAIVKVLKKSEIHAEEWIELVLTASPCMTAVFVAFTTIDSSERYYFVFLFAISFALVRWLDKAVKKVPVVLPCAVLAAMIVLGAHHHEVYTSVIRSNAPIGDPRYEVVNFLEENQYLNAYALFEDANTMTVLSNGDVQVSAVASVEKMNICKWMSSTDWYVPNVPYEAKTAYIVTEANKENFDVFLEAHSSDLEFAKQIGKYLIYFSDYNFSCLDD